MRLLRALRVLAMTALYLCAAPALAVDEPHVRVAILQDVPSVRVTVLAPCRLMDLKSGKLLAEWPRLAWQEVTADRSGGLKIGKTLIPSDFAVLEPMTSAALILINARPYRDSMILRRTPKGHLTLINRLDLEEYLVGALNSEVSAGWPMEALKAHAVVSRTMTAHRIWIRKGQEFDMTADVSTHLYHGVAAERGRTRQAVEETRGQVLAYDGELFSATFHANCGGHTENVAELWEVKQRIPPLHGVPDPHCKNLKHYRWSQEVSAGEFKQLLGPEAAQTGEIQAAEIVDRNESGRVRSIRLIGSKGTTTLTGRRFRELLGANRLRSLNFTIHVEPGRISLAGFGWGHGVGLCQWGAFGMARQGRTMDEILSFYFPQSKRRVLEGLPGFN